MHSANRAEIFYQEFKSV